MCETRQQIRCPHCQWAKVVKNGKKTTGEQNYRCKNCSKQFQHQYFYNACDPKVRTLIERMLLRGNAISDICAILLVSTKAVLRLIVRWGQSLQVKPRHKRYFKVQIDEMWSFVGSKQKKVWILYAYCAESKEILAVTMGKRNQARIRDLLKRLENIQIDFYCTDGWKEFAALLPYFQHVIGKKHTKAIEGRNCWVRRRLARLTRKATTFSKKLVYHWYHFKILVCALQNKTSYI